MRLHQIDLNLLVTFDAIYATRNLTHAAKTLHLSQPAISHALVRLRDLFGDSLFTRGPRGMVPTPFARSVAEPIHAALAGLERGIGSAKAFCPIDLRRTFHIGLRDVLEFVLLPRLVARLSREAPHVELVIHRVSLPTIAEALAEGDVDVVLDITTPVGPDTHQKRVFGTDFVVALRTGHPACGTERRPLDLDAYLSLPHLRVSSNLKSPGLEDLALASLDCRRRIAVRCHSYSAACRTVALSDLALTLPRVYVPGGLARELTFHPVPFPMNHVDVHLYWHASSDADRVEAWLRRVLDEVAREATSFEPLMAEHAPHSVDVLPTKVQERGDETTPLDRPLGRPSRRRVRAGEPESALASRSKPRKR